MNKNKVKRRDRLAAARARGTHTREEWLAMVAFFNECCVRCGTNEYHVERDHIIPLYQPDSSDSIRNIQPLCARCNASKGPERIDHRGENIPEEWKPLAAGVEV